MTKIDTAFVSLRLSVLLLTCVQLTMQGCISRSINRYKNKPRSRLMLLFSSSLFQQIKNVSLPVVAIEIVVISAKHSRNISLKILAAILLRMHRWPFGYGKCIFGFDTIFFLWHAHCYNTFFEILQDLHSYSHSHTHSTIGNRFSWGGQWNFSKRVEIFHLKTFNWCTTKTTKFSKHHSENSLKIRFTLLHTNYRKSNTFKQFTCDCYGKQIENEIVTGLMRVQV